MIDAIFNSNIRFIELNRNHCRPIYGTDDEQELVSFLNFVSEILLNVQ
jgi:hypothetical protein